MPDPIIVADDDQLDTFLLFSNSHDGTYPIDIRISTVRVVCNNTLNLALWDKTQGRVFRRGHSDRLALVKEEAVKFFEFVLATQREAQARLNTLAQAACDAQAFTRFLEKLLPIPAKPATAARDSSVARAHETRRIRIEEARKQVAGIYVNGDAHGSAPGECQAPAPKNWWGALNSVTAWVDHVQEIDGDRFSHAMFGGGDDMKSKAFALSREFAGTAK